MRCCCSTSIPRRPFADGTPVVRHSLSRLAFTGCIRLDVGVVTGSNYTEFKAVASDGAVMQIYANDDGIAYRKLVNGSWKTIWSK